MAMWWLLRVKVVADGPLFPASIIRSSAPVLYNYLMNGIDNVDFAASSMDPQSVFTVRDWQPAVVMSFIARAFMMAFGVQKFATRVIPLVQEGSRWPGLQRLQAQLRTVPSGDTLKTWMLSTCCKLVASSCIRPTCDVPLFRISPDRDSRTRPALATSGAADGRGVRRSISAFTDLSQLQVDQCAGRYR